MNTSLLRRSDSPAISTGPWPPHRARRLLWTFFERPAAREAGDSPAHSGRRHLHSQILLKGLAMLSERQVGVVFELVWQPLLKHRPLPGWRTGYGARLHVAALPSPPQPALDRGHGDPEDARHLVARHLPIDGV